MIEAEEILASDRFQTLEMLASVYTVGHRKARELYTDWGCRTLEDLAEQDLHSDDRSRLEVHIDAAAAHPAVARYLASPRRIPFNENGIFRAYRELDGE